MLEKAVPSRAVFEEAIGYLLKKKWITSQQEFQRRIGDKTEKVATLAVPA